MYFFDTLNFFMNSKATFFASECIDPNLILLISRDRYVQKNLLFVVHVFTFTQKVKSFAKYVKYVMTFSIDNIPIKSEIKGESYSFFTSCPLENDNFFPPSQFSTLHFFTCFIERLLCYPIIVHFRFV